MFIVSLTYVAPLSEIDAALEEHGAFLSRHFHSGVFLASGPKDPRTGGVILATVSDRKTLDEILDEDPFRRLELARYDVEKFRPTRFRDGLDDATKGAIAQE